MIPITTATNTRRQADQDRELSRLASRSPRTARPPTSPTWARRQAGTVTPINTATNTPGKPITVGDSPGCHRDHPERQDRLRRRHRQVGHGDPDQHRHQQAGQADQGRAKPRMPSRSPPTAKPSTSRTTASGTVTPINTATNTAGQADQGRQRARRHRDHPGRQDSLRRQRRLEHGHPDPHRHQHRQASPSKSASSPAASRSPPTGRPPTSPSNDSGTVTPIRTATNTALKPDQGRERAPMASRSRHQHHAQGDQGRELALCHHDHAVKIRPLSRPVHDDLFQRPSPFPQGRTPAVPGLLPQAAPGLAAPPPVRSGHLGPVHRAPS